MMINTNASANSIEHSNLSRLSSSISHNGSQISQNEYNEIEKVIRRAAQIEQKELNRVNMLYQQFDSINKPQGNGDTECLICNCNLTLLLPSNRKICNSCLKNVCSSCSIYTVSTSNHPSIWLCKICAEYKDFLKKSGGWFNKVLPLWSVGDTPSISNVRPTSLVLSQYEQENLNIPNNATPKNNNYLSYNLNNDNLDDETLIFNSSSTSNKSHPQQNDKTSNTLLSNSSNNTNNNRQSTALNDSSTEFDFEHFSKEKLKQDLANSSKLAESEHSMFSFSSTGSVQPPKSSFTFDSNPNKAAQESITDLAKSIQNQISASRNVKLAASTTVINNQSSSQLFEPGFKNSLISSSELGSIQFSVEYIQSSQKLKIHLISATNLPACDSNGLSDPYVKLHLLPGIAKATKLRSKTIYKNLNPKFNETLQYDGIDLHDLDEKTLRLTVLDEDKFSFDFIGEYRLPLKTIIQNEINYFDVDLEPKKQLGDETDDHFRGKINFSLKYSKKENCLYVKINRCRQLLPMDNGKSSDPFVEISLLPFSKENHSKQKFKTSVKWKTLDPEYLEEFKFTNIDLKTLLNKTIEISVWDKDFGMKSDFIGIVQLGQQRTGDELKHFFTVVKNPELYHEQWHTLHTRENM